jgi:CheY-like chemotaxis protein
MNTISIFLVDDDRDDGEIFTEALDEIPLETSLKLFTNGQDLLEHLDSKNLPDVLFMDLHMPKMDGFECLNTIRSTPGLNDIPVFMYATSHLEDEVNDLMKMGADRYIQKPNSFHELKGVLYYCLKPFQCTSQDQGFHANFKFSA